jgi:hypothetical protein
MLTNKYIFQWALMTLLDPSRAVENLIYIGYSGDPTAAVRLTRRRRLDRKKQQSDRNVFHCFVFGPKKSGKSALVNSFIGRFNSTHLLETHINYIYFCLYSSWYFFLINISLLILYSDRFMIIMLQPLRKATRFMLLIYLV